MDPIAILGDLKKRVERLERTTARRPRPVKIPEPGTAALLAMHSRIKRADDMDIQAITRWLTTPTKKNAPSASGNSAEGNTTRKAMQ